ncbi:MAG: hypothetical protein WBN90_12205 [Gammaproteobacteria bacterium]
MKRKGMKQKTYPMLLLLFAGLAMCMTTLSAADNSFLMHPGLDRLKDGDVMLVPIGRRGAGIRMSIQMPGQSGTASFKLDTNGRSPAENAIAEVHLSVVIPW